MGSQVWRLTLRGLEVSDTLILFTASTDAALVLLDSTDHGPYRQHHR